MLLLNVAFQRVSACPCEGVQWVKTYCNASSPLHFPCAQVFRRREKVWGWWSEKNLEREHPVNNLIAKLFKDDDRSIKELYESKLMLLLSTHAFCFHCVVCKLN